MAYLTPRIVAWVVIFCIGRAWADDFSPSPVASPSEDDAPYKFTGYVETDGHGSGSVAIHPKLVIGCAHVNYDNLNFEWLTDVRWYWKWNGIGEPTGSGLLLDGQYDFTSYGTLVKKSRTTNYAAPKFCNVDFVVNYSTVNTAGGEYADWIEKGGSYLQTSATSKFITGYPSGRYVSGDADENRMHETGPFSGKFTPRDSKYPDYLGMYGIETGPGNSGGPIWGWKNGEWALAGVLITGAEVADEGYGFAGVYAIGKNAWGRIISALGTVGALPGQLSGSFSLAGVPAETVNSGTIIKKFTVSGLVGFIDTMTLDLVINHSRRNDLRVELRSPAGTTLTMFNLGSRSGSSSRNLVCTGKKIPGFRGFHANGVWILSVKDAYPANGGTLVSASLGITTR